MVTAGDSAHLHAVTSIGTGGPATYTASYDAAGNIVCRAPNATTCVGTPTGAQLSYDIQGRLVSWGNGGTSVSGESPRLRVW